MKNMLKMIVSLVVVLSPMSLFANDILNKKVTIRAENYTSRDLLEQLSFRANIPIGFVEISNKNETEQVFQTINIKSGSVKDVLNEFKKNDNRYKWYIDDGIVNVIPIRNQDNILKTKISSFSYEEIDVEQLKKNILNTSEVKTKLKELGLIGKYSDDYDGPIRDLSKFSINFSNVTVQKLLNQTLKQGVIRFWWVGSFNNNAKYLTIDLIPKLAKI